MKAARTPTPRLVMYHDDALKFDGAVALRKLIAQFVYGIKGERKNPVSEKQIVQWFKATKPEFVKRQITEACASGAIRCVRNSLSSSRRHNGSYRYEPALPTECRPA
jgi:hypothetical protein